MPTEARNDQVMIRVTPSERRRLEVAAHIKGEKVSTILRDVILRWAKRVSA